jgi:hypothetical protein
VKAPRLYFELLEDRRLLSNGLLGPAPLLSPPALMPALVTVISPGILPVPAASGLASPTSSTPLAASPQVTAAAAAAPVPANPASANPQATGMVGDLFQALPGPSTLKQSFTGTALQQANSPPAPPSADSALTTGLLGSLFHSAADTLSLGHSSLAVPGGMGSGAGPLLPVARLVSAVTGPLLGTVQAVTHPVLDTVQTVASPVLNTVQAITQPIPGTVQTVSHSLLDTAEAVSAPVLNTIPAVAQPVVNTVPTVTQALVDTVETVTTGVPSGIRAVTYPVLTAVPAVTGPVLDQVSTVADRSTGISIGRVGITVGVNADPGQAPVAGNPFTPPLVASPESARSSGSEPGSEGRPATVGLVPDGGTPSPTPAPPGVSTVWVSAEPAALPFPALESTPIAVAPLPAPRLSRDLFLVPGPVGGSEDSLAERLPSVADQAPRGTLLAQALPADPFVDFAEWGAATDAAAADGVAVELPAAPAASGRLTASPDVLAAALRADSGAEALGPAQADLRATCVPFDAAALEADFRRLLDQLQALAWDFSSLLARLQGTPWFVAAALLAATCEVGRRRLRQRSRAGLALAAGGGTLTWFPTGSTRP